MTVALLIAAAVVIVVIVGMIAWVALSEEQLQYDDEWPGFEDK